MPSSRATTVRESALQRRSAPPVRSQVAALFDDALGALGRARRRRQQCRHRRSDREVPVDPNANSTFVELTRNHGRLQCRVESTVTAACRL